MIDMARAWMVACTVGWALVVQLGHPFWRARDDAQRQLELIVPLAEQPLRSAASSPDPEIRRRAAWVLMRLDSPPTPSRYHVYPYCDMLAAWHDPAESVVLRQWQTEAAAELGHDHDWTSYRIATHRWAQAQTRLGVCRDIIRAELDRAVERELAWHRARGMLSLLELEIDLGPW